MFSANWKSRSTSRSKSREKDAKYISAALIPSAAFIVNPTTSLEYSNKNETQNNLLNSTLNSSLLGLSSENIDKDEENKDKQRKESKLSKENSISNSQENLKTGKQKSLSLRGRKKTKEKPRKESKTNINGTEESKHGIEIANGLYERNKNKNFKRPETPTDDYDSPIYSIPMKPEPTKLLQSNEYVTDYSIQEFYAKPTVDLNNDLSEKSDKSIHSFFQSEEDFKKSSNIKDVPIYDIDSDENIDFEINKKRNMIGSEDIQNPNSRENSFQYIPNRLHKSSPKTFISNPINSNNAEFYSESHNEHFNHDPIEFRESIQNKNTNMKNIEYPNSKENFSPRIPNGLYKSSSKTGSPSSTNLNNVEMYAEIHVEPNNEHFNHDPIEFKESTQNKNTNMKDNLLISEYYGLHGALSETHNDHKNKPIEMQYTSNQNVPKPPIKSHLNSYASPQEFGFMREDIENLNADNSRQQIPKESNKTPPKTGINDKYGNNPVSINSRRNEYYAEVHNERINENFNHDHIGLNESIPNKNTNMKKLEYNSSNKQVKDEIRLLHDTIYRLNIQLSTQISNNEPGRSIGKIIFPGKGPVPSWLLNTKYLAPLLVFYDKKYNEKSAELQKMQLELQNFEKELIRVIKENERLHLKLQENHKGGPFSNQADWQVIVQQAKLVIEENRLLLEEIEVHQQKIFLLENNSFSEMAKLKKSLLTVTSERDALDEEIKNLTQRLAELKGNTLQLSFNQESPKSHNFGSLNEGMYQNQLKINDSVIDELKNDKRKLEQEIYSLKQNEIKQEKKLQKYKKIIESEKKFREYFNGVLEKSDEVISEHNSLLETYGILNKEINRIAIKLKAEVSFRTDLNINDQENKFTTKNGDNEFLDKLYFVESLTEMLMQNVDHLNQKCKNQENEVNKYQLLLQEKDKYIQEWRQENEEIEEKLGNLLKNASDEY